MINGLTVTATMLSLWLFMCALNDSIDIAEHRSEERREQARQRAYARKRVEWTIHRNRDSLWADYTKEM